MRILVAILTGFLIAPAVSAAGLNEVLANMNQAAASFRDVTADVEKTNFTAVISDTEIENGKVWMSRANGTRLRIEISGEDERSLAMDGRKGEIYYPKPNLVSEYDLGKAGNVVDQFLLLGFGTSGKDLARDYQVKALGEEQIAGVGATCLELVPKSGEARKQLTRAELWIADEGGYPVQQKFYTPSGNTTTLTYTNIEINPGLSPSDLTL